MSITNEELKEIRSRCEATTRAPMIDLSCFVEAKVMVIKFNENDREIQIDFQYKGNESFSLICTGVVRFLANELREQNIIDRAILWNTDSDQTELKDSLRYLISGRLQEDVSDAFYSLIEDELFAIKKGESFLFELEPIYGASILVLAKSFRIKKMN